jgi:hypothetical protein
MCNWEHGARFGTTQTSIEVLKIMVRKREGKKLQREINVTKKQELYTPPPVQKLESMDRKLKELRRVQNFWGLPFALGEDEEEEEVVIGVLLMLATKEQSINPRAPAIAASLPPLLQWNSKPCNLSWDTLESHRIGFWQWQECELSKTQEFTNDDATSVWCSSGKLA